jgi:hypothetical protein
VKPKTCAGCGKVTADREELETKWIQVFVEFQHSTHGPQHQDADLVLDGMRMYRSREDRRAHKGESVVVNTSPYRNAEAQTDVDESTYHVTNVLAMQKLGFRLVYVGPHQQGPTGLLQLLRFERVRPAN